MTDSQSNTVPLEAVADDNCPFCGSSDWVSIKSSDRVHPYYCVCRACGAQTAHHGDATAALKAWARRAALTSMGEGWQPIETAPAHGRVLVVGGRHTEPEIVEADGPWWTSREMINLKAIPTHWQPLPALPAISRGDHLKGEA